MNKAEDRARLFFALWPDDSVRDALASLQAGWEWPPHAARVTRERLHITLHFLGELPRSRMPELQEAAACAFTPFVLELQETGVWPSNGVAWVRSPAAPEALLELHADLGRALHRLGLPVEKRRFEPHVTLARRALRAKPPERMAPISWPVGGYALVESELRPPARYRVMREYP